MGHGENGIRTLLYYLSTVAARHNKIIEPQLSFHSDFYLRCFIKVNPDKASTLTNMMKHGQAIVCEYCQTY